MAKLRDLSSGQRRLLFGTVAIVVLAGLLLAAEAAVRVRQHMKSGTAGGIEKTFTVDEASGLRVPIAGLVSGSISINKLGFRGPEIESPKPPETVRLAFLGASTTYNGEVSSNEATWAHLVVEQLRSAYPQTRFDYINASVPGYTVDTSVRNLRERVSPLQPDVIFIYHATNDLSFASKTLAEAAGLDTDGGSKMLSWPSKYSTLWYLVEKNLQIRARQRQSTGDAPKLTVDRAAISQTFRDDLTELVVASKDVAKLVAVLTFSHQQRADQSLKRQAQAAVTSLYYMPYMSLEGLLEGFSAFNEVIREVATGHGALLITDEHVIPGDSTHFTDSVHFTDAGSKLMSERVINALAKSADFIALASPEPSSSSDSQLSR